MRPSNSSEAGHDSSGWSATQWAAWVAECVEARKRTFLNEPEEMIGAYNRERTNMDDYRGRELLELLQNADDAGDAYGPNRVLIRHWSEGLCLANSGVPFSTGGVKSLMVGNYSPKKLARTKQIGNRGLGFRSILSWTQTPFIFSGNLRLVFSRSLARATLGGLIAQSDQLRATVEEWQRGGHEAPIPILACPAVVDCEGRTEELGECETLRRMWRRASALREQYDTIIALPFSEPGADKQALEQVESLKQELMLFLQYIEELVIETEDRRMTWRAKREQNEVTVTSEPGPGEPSRWRIHQRTGLIPEEKLSPSERSRQVFEIRIAVAESGGTPGVLLNYFPTKIRFPYPVVAHATMELTSNRQNLINSDANRYIAGQLAQTLAEVAELSTTESNPWYPLSLLAWRGQGVDPVLDDLGFDVAMREAARQKRLVPRRDGQLTTPGEVRCIPVDAKGWVPEEGFEDLVLWTDDYWLKQALKWLGASELESDDFRSRAERVSVRLTLAGRAAFLAGILQCQQHGFLPKNRPAALLIDRDNDPIAAETIAYFPPTGGMLHNPPNWVPLRFVSAGLVDELCRIRGRSRERLVEELREAGYKQVQAYDFGGLGSAVVSHTNRRCRETPEHEAEIRREGLRALRELLESVPEPQRPKRDAGLSVLVPTRQGQWKNADELYLGEPYPSGSVMEALLGQLQPECFVAGPEALGPGDDGSVWEPVLMWLGASEYPRTKTVQLSMWNDQDYVQYARVTARYPIQFEEFTVATPEDLSLESVRVTSVQNLEELLERCDPHAILGWIALDARPEQWYREGDRDTKMGARFRVQTFRYSSGHPLPSYVLWLLRERSWLPTMGGERRPPSRCLLAKTTNPELHEVLPCPAIDPEHPILRRVGVGRQSLTRALVLLGVRMNVDDLSWEQCYDLMLNLPEIDPEGRAATRIYRLLATKEEPQTASRALLTLQDRFKKTGKLWACTKRQWCYVPVQGGVYFASDTTLPQPVTDAFPTIDLPRGRGTDKVARVFAVKVLRTRDVSLQVVDYAKAANCEVLEDEVRRLKPYVLALRLDSTPDIAGIGLFKKLSLIACTWVAGEAVVNGTDVRFRLSREGQVLIHEDRAYLVVPASGREHSLEDVVLARHVGNILAGVLQVERASDFAQLAIARDPTAARALLTDILGHEASEVLQKAREALQASDDEQNEWPIDLPLIKSGAFTGGSIPGAGASPGSDQPASPEARTATPAIPEKVTTEQALPGQTSLRRPVEQRLQAKRSSKDQVVQTRRVTDGNRCEELAERFEESQGRFPLSVAGLQGTQAFGCDLLSFSSPTDRERFVQERGKPIDLVQRFIEVKGRSSARGSVPLEGNEKNAARERKERYHIYRVYEAEAGRKWQVVELADPLAYDWDVSYDVDLFKSSNAKYWAVEGYETKGSEASS